MLCGSSDQQSHPPRPAWIKVSLPRHDLLGEERWPISLLSKEDQELVPQWAFIGFNLHRNTKHILRAQSLSGSNDQTIDNKQRTLRAYSELGSVS